MLGDTLKRIPGLENIFFRGADKKQLLLSFGANCGHCGALYFFQKIEIYVVNLLDCPVCGQSNAMPSLLDIKPDPEVVRDNLDFWLREYKRLAFWGLGRMFRALIDPALLDRPGVHLLDAEVTGRFGPKTVEQPSAVLEHGLRLIVTVPDFAPAHRIIRREAEKYGVTKIIDLYDLMTPRIRLAGQE